MKKIADMSPKELKDLEEQLAKRKKSEKEKREKARLKYESHRDKAIIQLMKEAKELSEKLGQFKEKCHLVMDEHANMLNEYGGMRGNSKGGFSITNSAGDARVVRRRDTTPFWDERATKGVALIKEFLHDFVKKRDIKLFDILISFLQRNKDGDLEYSRVMNLMQHEDKFEDPRWHEGLKLIKESYSNTMKAFAYEFKVLAANGSWTNLPMNFSAI